MVVMDKNWFYRCYLLSNAPSHCDPVLMDKSRVQTGADRLDGAAGKPFHPIVVLVQTMANFLGADLIDRVIAVLMVGILQRLPRAVHVRQRALGSED
jgi:hypothetical protein